MASPVDAQLTQALEQQTRAILTELDKRFTAIDSKWELRVGALESQAADFARHSDEFASAIRTDVEAHLSAADADLTDRVRYWEATTGARVTSLESALHGFEAWRPRMESSVEALQSTMDSVRAELSKVEIQWSHGARVEGFSKTGILGACGSAPVGSSATVDHADGSRFGPRFVSSHRECGFGPPVADLHYLVKGTWSPNAPASFEFPVHHDINSGELDRRGELSRGLGGLPKINFPVFDGSNPKLWQKQCEDYFDMYATEEFVWIKAATMHFHGVAARWLSWRQFCQFVYDRFGRQQHELVIQKLFHIKQTSTVQDYIDRFCELVDLLVTYEHTTDPLYYTMRFIDGLRADIKSVILVQRPGDLDTACSLALLQEAAESSRRPELVRGEHSSFSRPLLRAAPTSSYRGEQPRGGGGDYTKTITTVPTTVDSKVASLRAYRRAKGLCQYCAEKWNKGHKCADTVQLHAVQELWEMLSTDQPESEGEFEDSAEHFLILLSTEAASVNRQSKSFRLPGVMQGVDMLMLIDSGSTHSFLNSAHTNKLSGITPMDTPLSVRVANGTVLQCSMELPQASWSVQDLNFCTTFKVLPLPFYDAILGMDWLEQLSPMTVDWKHKWLSIPYAGSTVILQGCNPLVPVGTVLEIHHLPTASTTPAQMYSVEDLQLPDSMMCLLRSFHDVFQPPSPCLRLTHVIMLSH
jgi:hypothetical protein